MKRLLCLWLTATLAGVLAACAPAAPSAPATEPAVTAETAAPAPSPAPIGDFFALPGYEDPTFNSGTAWYSLEEHPGYCLVTETDYATATRRVLCRLPGCAHDSSSCPAWLPGQGREVKLFTVGEAVLVYHPVATMHITDSWEDYYAQVVEPALRQRPLGWEELTDEEMVAIYRGRYEERSAPAGVYIIAGDGTSRREIPASRDLTDVGVGWCDGIALYGVKQPPMAGRSEGYRISLADGTVTTFPLLEQERIVGAQGQELLTEHLVTEVPLPDYNTDGEAYQAVLQNATREYDWLNPATGTRRKVLEQPYEGNRFCGLCNGKLYWEEREPLGDGAYRRNAFCRYDAATGQWQDLLRPLPDDTIQMWDATVAAPPDAAARQGRYLRLSGSDSGQGENLTWVLDTQSGALTALPSLSEASSLWPLALTDDGRFLVQVDPWQEAGNGVYGLISAESLLQGSTDYTPVTNP